MAGQAIDNRVWEGTWQEVLPQAASLPPEQRVRLELLSTQGDEAAAKPPNHAMLNAMREAEKIQRGMNPVPPPPGLDAVSLVREARAGAMWADEHSDEHSE